jgi:GTP-binding protein HflX
MSQSVAPRPAAILASIQLPETPDEEHASSLAELGRLVETLGFEVVGTVSQKRPSPVAATLIGPGKVDEIAAYTTGTAKQRASHVIFDHELTPTQLRNLTDATGAEVLDRTGVIVEIFYRHAKTREAKLQVEIARLNYLAPRIRATGPGERQGGGVGAKGVGETEHELDRRRIRDRVAELTRELKLIHSDQSHRRARRHDQCLVALVGYTNAGKSSLMRALTGSSVLVADKLFATLDTTVRALHPETYPRILVSDTVGFIKKLPHDLVASFRSTLEEAAQASLLLYVVDAADPTFRSQLEVTRQVLSEIDAASIPSLVILNKWDKVDEVQRHLVRRDFPEAIAMSALEPSDVDGLKRQIREFFEKNMEQAQILLPYELKGMVGEVRRHALVLDEKYDESGARFTVKAYPEELAKLRALIAGSSKKRTEESA